MIRLKSVPRGALWVISGLCAVWAFLPQGEGFVIKRNEIDCIAYDVVERYDFSSLKGMVFAFFDSVLQQSFTINLCNNIETMAGDIDGISNTQTRFSTNVQGVFNEFLIKRFWSSTYLATDARTWDSGNVANYRMRLNQGSTGPPCDKPLDLSAGAVNHAPVVGGRTAEVNIYCGGCPEWPSNWQSQSLQAGESELINQYCTTYKKSTTVNNGRPRTVDPITGMAVIVTDSKACVCSVKKVSDCTYHFNITTTCPVAQIAFNEEKRMWTAAATAVVVGGVLITYLVAHFRHKTNKFGKKYALLDGLDRAADTFMGHSSSLVKTTLTVVQGDDVIPARPPRRS